MPVLWVASFFVCSARFLPNHLIESGWVQCENGSALGRGLSVVDVGLSNFFVLLLIAFSSLSQFPFLSKQLIGAMYL